MKFFGVPPPEDDRRRRRLPNDDVGRLDDVADDVGRAGRLVAVTGLREAHPNRGIRDGRAEDRHFGAVGRGQDAVVPGVLPQLLAQLVEELARRVRPALELEHECRDPLVVLAELVLARERVVDPIDALGRERSVIERRRADEVAAAPGLVQVVIEVGARRDEAVDVPVLDEVREDEPHAAGRQRPGGAEKDRRVAREHLFPDPPRRAEVASLERHALHARDDVVHRCTAGHRERLDGLSQKTRFASSHALFNSKSSRCSSRLSSRHVFEKREVGDR